MEVSLKRTRTVQAALALAVFACGMAGSISVESRPQHLLDGDFVVSVSSAAAREARGPVRQASCIVVRYYVARYTAVVAEAWARSKGATDAEIESARACIKPQQTTQVSVLRTAIEP
jgi:hypothetical protein